MLEGAPVNVQMTKTVDLMTTQFSFNPQNWPDTIHNFAKLMRKMRICALWLQTAGRQKMSILFLFSLIKRGSSFSNATFGTCLRDLTQPC